MTGLASLNLILVAFFSGAVSAQFHSDTINIHFLYGSKPAKSYKHEEPKVFGGLKGGHVNIEVRGKVPDFMPGNCPLFPCNKKPTGGFRLNSSVYWDTSTSQWMTIKIPATLEQVKQLDSLISIYTLSTPFDYAVFGVRCAAATYHVLAEIDLFEPLSTRKNVIRHFYPKLLRKRMLKWARKNNYPVIKHPGKPSRKWETDKGVL